MAAAGVVLALVAGSLAPEPPGGSAVSPTRWRWAARPVGSRPVVAWVGVALFLAGLVAAVALCGAAVLRRPWVERQQLRWVAAATATVAAICVMVPMALSGVAPAVPVVLFPLASLCVPVPVAAAMLRYRLWDLDRLVSRTVTCVVVTALLAPPTCSSFQP